MRDALGDGYTEALRKAWKGDVPESADLVMFWWCKAAAETAQGRCKRFGFITTNSIHQTFNRRVIEPFVAAVSNRQAPLHLAYAIPDHPWIDSADGAAVRIAMTVAAPGKGEGILKKVIDERPMEHGENEVSLVKVEGVLAPNLQIGSDLTSCQSLRANENLSNRGFCLFGAGFIVEPAMADSLLKTSDSSAPHVIWNYRNGKDLTNRPRGVMVIDAFPISIEELQAKHPGVYQHLLLHVKPERDNNSREGRKKLWWAFGEPNKKLREQLFGLPRYIATVETSKHRFFTFLDQNILPDNMLVCVASDDAFHLGVLSSNIHVTWALARGGTLEDRPRYNKSVCFDPFPFPALEEGELKQRIRDLGERLDAHRKRQQELHPGLTLTGIYNVLEKLRADEPLTAKDKQIHDQGLVTLLKQIHDELDAAVLEAYGWQDLLTPATSSPSSDLSVSASQHFSLYPEALLTRLVTLNHERAAEEKRGLIRWLRPDYQNPVGRGGLAEPTSSPQATQSALDLSPTETHGSAGRVALPSWPERLPDQVTLIRQLLTTEPAVTAEQLSSRFGRKNAKRTEQIEGIIETLRGLGQV
jgi:hypothetical protein